MTGTIAKKGILTDGSGLARRGTPPLLRKLGYKSFLRTGLFHAIYSSSTNLMMARNNAKTNVPLAIVTEDIATGNLLRRAS